MQQTQPKAIESHPLEHLLTSVILYTSQYPFPEQFQSLKNICQHSQILIDQFEECTTKVIKNLINNIYKQIVYGPSGSYIKVLDRPHCQHLNINFLYSEQEMTEYREQKDKLVKKVRQYVNQNGLSTVVQADRIEELLWYNNQRFLKLQKFINKKLSKSVLQLLETDGESWSRSTPVPTLLLTLKFSLRAMLNKIKTQQNYADLQTKLKYMDLNLYMARICFLHNKILQTPVKALNEEVLTNYGIYINILKTYYQSQKTLKPAIVKQYIRVLLQYMHALTFYYKYEQAQTILQYCKKLANIEISFTGKLGRRTKYQSFDIAQLVMNIKQFKSQIKSKQHIEEDDCDEQQKIQDSLIDIPSASQLVIKQLSKQQITSSSLGAVIEQSKFDEQSILLEQPKLTQQGEGQKDKSMSQTKLLIAICYLQYIYRTTPKEEMLYQQISTSIQQLMKYSQIITYPVLFNILMLRSKNEFKRVKNALRAIQQFEVLKQEYNTKQVQQKAQQPWIGYSVNYWVHLGFIAELADMYFEIGMVITAVQLYQQVGMIDQCIDGLISRNYKDKAKQKIFHLLLGKSVNQSVQNIEYSDIDKNNKNKTPRILCMLADIYAGKNSQKALQLYEEAWQLSNKKFSRAQRSIGWIYLNKKQFEKAANAFKLATQVHYYNPNTWFTLGCCYMSLKEYSKALSAFSQSISIDNTQGEAWGNMSSCYIFREKFKEAYSTLTQAVKHSQNNWKLWANFLSVSFKLKKFYKYFQCIQKIVQLEKHQIITKQVLSKISVIFRHYRQNTQRRTAVNTMKDRLNKLYTFLISKIGQHPKIWHSIFQFSLQVQNLVIQNYKHYVKLFQQSSINKSDIISDYQLHLQSLADIKQVANKQLNQTYENILQSKQKQLNMCMNIGWENTKSTAQNVLQILSEYIWVWDKYATKMNQSSVQLSQMITNDKFSQVEHELFVEGVRKKIEHCLERKIQLPPKKP